MRINNNTQEALATTQLSTALARIASTPCTMDLKRGVLEGSVFQSLAFHLRLFWKLKRYHKLNDLVSRAGLHILKTDENRLTQLLHTAQEGGIGQPHLSDLIHMRKLVARLDEPGTDVECAGWESFLHHPIWRE